MAAFGRILRKATLSNHSTADYTPVNQDASDNEEEDDVVFTKNGVTGQQNGFEKSSNNNAASKTQQDLEMGQLGIKKAKIIKSSEVEVRVMKMTIVGKTRILCFILTFLLCILVALGSALYFGAYKVHPASKLHKYTQSAEWAKNFPEFYSETPLRVIDVDGDGRLDVITAILHEWGMTYIDRDRNSIEQLCLQENLEYPCVSVITAVRGYDGEELYRLMAHHSVFELNCEALDINRDGQLDCVAAGRSGTLTAFDSKNGTVLWRGDVSSVHQTWNVYNILALPDFSSDGVPEILIADGGDPAFGAKERKRGTARLVMLDGATGHAIGRHLEMPEPRETYMSPVMHTRKDGSQYVLFGDGGETVSGSLLAISVPDLYRYVMMAKTSDHVPLTKGTYKGWDKFVVDKNVGILELYRSSNKGVMVPPVCVDVTLDGVRDILQLTEDGTIIMLDGETLKELWHRKLGQETYSSPAPGYFNSDDVLDFMFLTNSGTFPDYTSEQLWVIDGRSGNTLWTLNATVAGQLPIYWSDLSVRTKEKHRDAYIFRSFGRLDNTRTTRVQRSARNGEGGYQPQLYGDQQYPYEYQHSRYSSHQGKGQDTYQSDGYGNRQRSGYGNQNRYPQQGRYQYYDDDNSDYAEQDWSHYFYPDTLDEGDEVGSESAEEEEQSVVLWSGSMQCGDDLDPATSEVFIFDRSTMRAPLLIAEIPALTFNITEAHFYAAISAASEADEDAADGRRRRRHSNEDASAPKDVDWASLDLQWPQCVVLREIVAPTGTIGDVDGDGTLDLLLSAVHKGALHIKVGKGTLRIGKFFTQLFKFNLGSLMVNATGRPLDVGVSSSMHSLGQEKPLQQVELLPTNQQPWLAYLGTHADSVYHP